MILFETYEKLSYYEVKKIIIENNEITKFDFYTIEYEYGTDTWYNIGIILSDDYEKYDGIF